MASSFSGSRLLIETKNLAATCTCRGPLHGVHDVEAGKAGMWGRGRCSEPRGATPVRRAGLLRQPIKNPCVKRKDKRPVSLFQEREANFLAVLRFLTPDNGGDAEAIY